MKIKDNFVYATLSLSEIIALAYDSILYQMQKEAAMWYRSYLYFAIRFLPLFMIGLFTMHILRCRKQKNIFYIFILFFIIDLLLLCINHFYLLFYDYIGISFVLGMNIGGIVHIAFSSKKS